MVKILLGTATTDENGKATFEYFAQGLGKIDFMAECNGIESNTITVNDAPTLYSDKVLCDFKVLFLILRVFNTLFFIYYIFNKF